MRHDFTVVIPARYHSTRFPGKLLQDLNGQPVIARVYQQACQAQPQRIIIATDHDEIYHLAKNIGAEVVMTDPLHESGTDRIAEAVKKLGLASDEIVVNVQGDEPFISPLLIQQVAREENLKNASMATLCANITDEAAYYNPNVVKVVRNRLNQALYFSRSPIPVFRDQKIAFSHIYRHIGLYAYRVAFLLNFVEWPLCSLEQDECLEQLRVLWHGYSIQVDLACVEPLQDINTQEDLLIARALMEKLPTI